MSDTPPSHCPNCDHRLAPWDHYCSQCGQHAQNHPPTLWEFVHEWIAHYVAAEGVLWKSLWGLMARPGFLTLEYLAGRRRRYVLPLRLVLTLGLVFFLLLKLSVSPTDMVQLDPKERAAIEADAPWSAASGPVPSVPPKPAASAIQAARAASSASEPIEADEPQARFDGTPAWMQERAQRVWEHYRKEPEAFNKKLWASVMGMAPYAVLASIPFYAGLLALVTWGRRRTYGEHFVFAMHLHAFWYGCLLLALIPSAVVGFGVWAWSNLYPLIALRRVYGGRWPTVLLRATVLVVLHWILLGLGMLTVLALGAMSA
jgi:hypothetical protein